jgi:hypothetical protein
MSHDIPVEIERLGPPATPGKQIRWVTVHDPTQSLWLALRRLVEEYDRTLFATYVDQAGRIKKYTRYDQGVLYGRMEATAESLAFLLRGHDFIHGDAGNILIDAARKANKTITE